MTRGRVLASNELAVSDDLLTPGLRRLDELSTSIPDNSLKRKRHRLCELDSLLLLVRESRDLLSLHQRLAIDLHIDKSGRTMADGRNRLAGSPELLDQLDALLVGREVEHGAVATGVEQSSELLGAAEELLDGGSLLPEVLVVLEEVLGGLILEHLDGARVERGDTALRRGDDDFGLGREDLVGVRELRLLVGVEMSARFLQNEVFF